MTASEIERQGDEGSEVPGSSMPPSVVVRASLTRARPWVLWYGMQMTLAVLVLSVAWAAVLGRQVYLWAKGFEAFELSSLGVLLLVGLALGAYTVPARALWRFGRRLGGLEDSNTPADFERAMEDHASFWCSLGRATLVLLALLGVAFGALFVQWLRTR